MKPSSCALASALVLIASASSLFAETPVGEDAVIQMPAGWLVGQSQAVEFVASNPENSMSIVFLKEVGTEIEVSSIEEYYTIKVTNLGNTLTDFKADPKKLGKINGLAAAFTVATSKIDQGENKLDSKMYLMMYEGGNGNYYMAMVATSPRLFDANSSAFMKMLQSFKMK